MNSTSHLRQEFLQAIEHRSFPVQPQNLYDPIRYILKLGGKRIRPLLSLMAADLFGFKAVEAVIPAALSVEYFHNFSLIHDDIMDNAPLRRGQATVHEKWDPNVAILSGDALLIQAYMELAKCESSKVPALLHVFNKMAQEVCDGQQQDMDFEQQVDVSLESYIEMIRLKTSVLLGGALQLGAILASASTADQQHIYNFGVNVGLAFQLQDDILDVYGNPETFGKQVGGDILSNKKTYLLISLFNAVQGEDISLLNDLIALDGYQHPHKVHAIMELYEKYHIKALAEQEKEHYTHLAYAALEKISVAKENKTALEILASELLIREI